MLVSDLATGVAVVSSQREAEVRGAVHAHHHVGNWHQHGSRLTEGHPQLLPRLFGQSWDDVQMFDIYRQRKQSRFFFYLCIKKYTLLVIVSYRTKMGIIPVELFKNDN